MQIIFFLCLPGFVPLPLLKFQKKCVLNHPTGPTSFFEDIDLVFKELNKTNDKSFLMGDFNMNILDSSDNNPQLFLMPCLTVVFTLLLTNLLELKVLVPLLYRVGQYCSTFCIAVL